MNPNSQFSIAKALVEFLSEVGIEEAVICPGSRNAPLIEAFSQSNFQLYSQVDERSAGYFALGLAKGSLKPVIVCCSSGTAVANLLPALIESEHQGHSLIIISADRPKGASKSCANQSIQQERIFGSYAHYLDITAYDLETFEHAYEANIRRNLHINIAFKEPFYEFEHGNPRTEFFKLTEDAELEKDEPYILEREEFLGGVSPLLIQGFGSPSVDEFKVDIPVYSDVTNKHYKQSTLRHLEHFVHHIEEQDQPNVLLTTGTYLLSKKLKMALSQQDIDLHIHFGNKDYISPFKAKKSIVLSESSIESILNQVGDASNYSKRLSNYDRSFESDNKYWVNENEVLKSIAAIRNHHAPSTFHAGNSMAVRYASLFSSFDTEHSFVLANRGTAGIDGCLSTFLGYCAQHPDVHHFLVIGDLSFLYDSNAFLASPLPSNFTILILNNSGGFIFNMLKGVNSLSNKSRELQTTSRAINLSKVSESFGLSHSKCDKAKDIDLNSQVIELELNAKNERKYWAKVWS